MPIILADDTWTRIEKMLEDYENGALGVVPGQGLKYEEQITTKRNRQPATRIGIDPSSTANFPTSGFPSINLNVCVGGSPVSHQFLVKL